MKSIKFSMLLLAAGLMAAVFSTDINMQKNFAIWAAGHGDRSCGFPTRCVVVE